MPFSLTRKIPFVCIQSSPTDTTVLLVEFANHIHIERETPRILGASKKKMLFFDIFPFYVNVIREFDEKNGSICG